MPATVTPENGVDRCDCGCKYWKGDRCVDCGDTFRQYPEWAAVRFDVRS